MLLDVHVTLGGRLGDAGGARAVLDYAPLEREARFLERVALSDWGFHGVLSLRGGDAGKFLHNIVSSDVAGLATGGAQPSLLLTAKGKVVGLFRVWRHGPEHLDLLVEAPCFPATKEALERYARVAKVPLEDRSRELGMLLVQGPEAAGALEEALACDAPKPGGVVETPAGNVLGQGSLASAPGFLLVVRREQARDAWERVLEAARKRGGGPVGWHACEAARVRAGVPRFGTECTSESLPGEAGMEPAVSYAKGCFVGQEVVARIKNLGHVNRLAVRLAPEGPCDEGEVLLADGKDAGRVTSVARGPGVPGALGVVRREHAEPGLTLQLPRGPARVVGPARLA